MTSRLCCLGALVLALSAGDVRAAAGDAGQASRPNIVFILCDDLGINDLHCYGRQEHHTPHLDRLAQQGLRFTSACCAQPICSPSRAAILTGKAPARLHLTTFLPGRPNADSQKLLHPEIEMQVPLEEKMICRYLKEAGYATAAIGKWHVGGAKFGPIEHGFDLYHPGKANTTPSATEGGKGEYDLTAAAEKFIEEHQDRPFFVYLAHNTPHIPYDAQPGRIDNNARAFEPVYAGVIETLDDTVGRLMAKLDALKLADKTLVIFTSDNGGLHVPEGPHPKITHNTPYRAGKGFVYQGGLRIPLIVRWPGHVPAGKVVDDPVINTDWVPTLVDLVGQPVPPGLDGVSLVPLLTGQGPAPERKFFWHFPHYTNQGSRPSGAVRDGRWMLVEYYDQEQVELYDLRQDIGETQDLAAAQPERVSSMRVALAAWRREVKAQSNTPNPDFDPLKYRQLYVDVDASRFAPAPADQARWETMWQWRKQMNRAVAGAERGKPKTQPNVIVILTDDQGFGELGATGNPVIRTPHIDRLAAQSVSLVNFHTMPVCSPTRACLTTGRYNYRTGVTDTFLGRSLMHPDETTLAEMLAAGGYRTGIFGKWHLGDNYPMRAMDRGFQESLVLNGGGLAQPGDPPDPADERGAYFNATLRHNGAWEKTQGYVSDVITEAAIQFIQQRSGQPFFVYLPFNCPHSPHQVPDKYRAHYQGQDFGRSGFPNAGHPMAAKQDPDVLARVYGMIENIDDNVGRLLAKLDELKLADNTIVVLFSDNGCQQHHGYNAGFRGWKGTPFEGGIHQFCFLRWPAQLAAGRKVDRIAAVIDLAPTLLDLCGVPKPQRVKFDGLSLAPLLRGQPVAWADRTLFFQWHRGDAPERFRAFAARSQDWKLVQPLGGAEKWDGKTNFQLYDMAQDPLELHDLAAQQPERVAQLKAQYEAWFDDVTGARDYRVPSRMCLGAPQENPVLLTRQDWRGPAASWGPKGLGYWEVNVVTSASYDVKLRFEPLNADAEATLSCGSSSQRQTVKAGEAECVFAKVPLPLGPGRLEAGLVAGPTVRGVKYLEVTRRD